MQVAGPGAGDGPRPGGRRLTPEGEVGHPGQPQSTKDPAPRVLRTTPHARVCYICGHTPIICGKEKWSFPFNDEFPVAPMQSGSPAFDT